MVRGSLVKTITKDALELVGFWTDKADVAVFHSHGTAGDFYSHKFIEDEAESLSKLGISFLTANNRGHDIYADIRKHTKKGVEWVQIGGGFERFEDCLFDIAAWLDFLSTQGIKKVILQGHSLSQKILYYQHHKKDPRVVGQIHLSASNDAGLMFYALGKEKYEKANTMINEMIKQGKGSEILPKELSPVSYVTSAQMYAGYLVEEGPGNLTPYHNPDSPFWHILEKTQDPMLFVFGGSDAYIKPSVNEAVSEVKRHARQSKNLSVKVIDGAPHSYIGYEKQLVDVISKWIKGGFLK